MLIGKYSKVSVVPIAEVGERQLSGNQIHEMKFRFQ